MGESGHELKFSGEAEVNSPSLFTINRVNDMTKRKQSSDPDIDICPVCVKTQDSSIDKDKDSFEWIQCSACSQWYHIECVNINHQEVDQLQRYHCLSCTPTHGPLSTRRRLKRSRVLIDYVALNEGSTFAVDKNAHPHIQEFKQFDAVDGLGYVTRDNVSKDFILEGERLPVHIPQCELELVGMLLPLKESSQITVPYITKYIGEDTPVEVMDVLTQQGVKPGWLMAKWRDYFIDPLSRDRIRNVISLEISALRELGGKFHRPLMVREMDIVDKVWPKSVTKAEESGTVEEKTLGPRPKVTKYCLMSVCGSFTDFHIDFGGTSVYYTVLSGSKQFIMFPPSDHNLKLYQSWSLEETQNFIWYPKYKSDTRSGPPKGGIKVTLKKGDLFIIPSGWIHSVYTPEDSVVIGGNYLTLSDLEMQLKINDIERNTKVPARFRFPSFNAVWWSASWYYYNNHSELRKDLPHSIKEEAGTLSPAYDIVSTLILHLKLHHLLSKTYRPARSSIPTMLIGNDIDQYLSKLEQWRETLK